MGQKKSPASRGFPSMQNELKILCEAYADGARR